MDKLYALLVGIDAYQPPLHALSGCLNDVEAMEEFLTGRFPKERLALKTLRNEEATRQEIIRTFREHLGQAGHGDTVLFFYAGHGSRELAPPEYWQLEPDRYDDTLVAYDSRIEGRNEWDLADKELRVLIAEVAKRQPHVVVILDSCHSGSATRDSDDLVVRRASPASASKGARGKETFWFFNTEVDLPAAEGDAGGWRILPTGRHVMLAACEDHQTAGECRDLEGKGRGRFSYHLIEALKELSGDILYRDLFKRVQTQVCNHTSHQVPQAYGELDAVLFDGSMPARPPVFYLRKFENRGWRLDAGKVHAVQERTVLDVFHEGAVTGEKSGPRLAKVEVTDVGATESAITVKEGMLPDKGVALPAIISFLPFPPLGVALKGGSPELKKSIDRSPYLRLTDVSAAEVVVEGSSEGIKLRYKDSAREMVAPTLYGMRGAQWVLAALEKIARWKALLGIANSGDALASQLRMTLYKWLGSPSTPGGEPRVEPFAEQDKRHGEEVLLPYADNGEPGRFTVCLENHSGQPLYYALFGLSEAFAIKMIEGATGRLPPEGNIWVREIDGIPGSVPDQYHQKGVTQRRDTLLLLVSDQQQTDFSRLEQTGVLDDSALRGEVADLQNLLIWRRYREVDEGPRKGRWAAQSQTFVSVRPPLEPTRERSHEPGRSSRSYRGELSLDSGVRLVHPDDFHGKARLLSTWEAAKRLGAALDPPALDGIETYPLALAGGWGSDGGLSVLELSGGDMGTVTAGDPLKIVADHPDLPEGEVPIVFVFDGREHRRVEAPGTTGFPVVIPRLPQPRSGDSLWLLFRSAKGTELQGK